MNYLLLARPKQWLKNFLVFAPLFFAREIISAEKLFSAYMAFVAFCLIASAIYVFNDLVDVKEDKLHPRKKQRPIAAGTISRMQAVIFCLALLVAGSAIVLLALPQAAFLLAVYIALNVLYTAYFKHIPVFDILIVSIFYFIRVEVGGLATATPISSWLVLCIFFLSLFIIIAKRKAEYSQENRRKVLAEYSESYLDHLLTISAGLTLLSYGIYTVLGPVPALAVYSNFFVIFALFRYLHIVYMTSRSEAPEDAIMDPSILASFVAWACFMFYIFY